MDKYTVKMFPQAYRDIDKIYEQALLVSNYADDVIALPEKIDIDGTKNVTVCGVFLVQGKYPK